MSRHKGVIMNDLNSISITGKLVKDGVLTYANPETAILSLDVAVNRSVKRGGEWVSEASFLSCSIFGKLAENICNKAKKGSDVAIEGAIRQERWEDKQTGKQKSKLIIIVEKIRVFEK